MNHRLGTIFKLTGILAAIGTVLYLEVDCLPCLGLMLTALAVLILTALAVGYLLFGTDSHLAGRRKIKQALDWFWDGEIK